MHILLMLNQSFSSRTTFCLAVTCTNVKSWMLSRPGSLSTTILRWLLTTGSSLSMRLFIGSTSKLAGLHMREDLVNLSIILALATPRCSPSSCSSFLHLPVIDFSAFELGPRQLESQSSQYGPLPADFNLGH